MLLLSATRLSKESAYKKCQLLLYNHEGCLFFIVTFLYRSYFICKKEEKAEENYLIVRSWVQRERRKVRTQEAIKLENLQHPLLVRKRKTDYETLTLFWDRLRKERQTPPDFVVSYV